LDGVGPGLVLTALLDRLGMSLHRAPAVALYTGLSGNHVLEDGRVVSSLPVAVGNLFFLQGVSVPTFGTDGALWSLANEFWYYMLFPLVLVAVHRRTPPLNRLLHGALFFAVAWLLRDSILASFPIWLLGALLAAVPAPKLGAAGPWIRSLAISVYVPLLYAFARSPRFQVAFRDDLLGLATFVFLWILLSASHPAAANSPATRCTRVLARFSYTLYVAHTPMLVLIAALLLGPTRWLPDGPHVAAGLSVLAFTLALCLLLATQTEFRTDTLRAAIERRFHTRSRPMRTILQANLPA
jgi:peptidoglycan/LPS O-acetylase OafA/YrhL